MCGIVQEAGYNEELQPWVEQMVAAQQHRSPYATGAIDIPIGMLGTID